jgi:predicted glycogen debranching enzyme
MSEVILPVRRLTGVDVTGQLSREWLVTNGLGGYASGTVCGAATRRYHGLLIAAHPAPLGRVMMFNHLAEQFRLPDWNAIRVGGVERTSGELEIEGADVLSEFRLEGGLPVWTFALDGHTVEKRVFLPYRQNTVHVHYKLVAGQGPLRVKLRPSVHFRGHDDFVNSTLREPYTLTASGGRYELASSDPAYPVLRLSIAAEAASLTLDEVMLPDILYRIEERRGYEASGLLHSPGLFRATLGPGRDVALTASTEPWETALAVPAATALEREYERRRKLLASAPAADTGFARELVLAADQFIITPAGRTSDTARANASGDEARTVIAGYHWFTDWGRDTMISLEGLTLCSGRAAEARYILHTFAAHVRDGLIPNFFPDRKCEGLYHTADATLWFFHALDRYTTLTGDDEVVLELLPVLRDIVARHTAGTRFGIGVDPADGLLRQGAEGYQLTWMDAKVGDWVVTPRRGKAVEINALWYNALRLLAEWDVDAGLNNRADHVQESFNRRFWNPQTNCLYDVIDGEGPDDPAVRPNQLLAVSLPHAVLDVSRWRAVVDMAASQLLTPVGLRSLAKGHPDYKDKYFGDLRARDAAYHQGTVWAWLIGPYADAHAKAYPERHDPVALLSGFDAHLSDACIGTISEVFDAEPPHTPRACVAQAWSVAEVLRLLTQAPLRKSP